MTITVDQRPGFSWSYSKLKNYETCPKRHYHYDIAKDVRDPETAEILHGNRMHDAYAKYLKAGTPLPAEFQSARSVLDKLRAAPGKKHVEQKWAITSSFQHAPWQSRDAWYRGVADFGNHNVDTHTFTIIDWKSGKVKEDTTQLALLAALTFINFPTVQRVRAALMFMAYGQAEKAEYVRGDQKEIWTEILPRVKALRVASESKDYPPKPGFLCRKWCGVVSCPHHGR
jgi:hypothetical protein